MSQQEFEALKAEMKAVGSYMKLTPDKQARYRELKKEFDDKSSVSTKDQTVTIPADQLQKLLAIVDEYQAKSVAPSNPKLGRFVVTEEENKIEYRYFFKWQGTGDGKEYILIDQYWHQNIIDPIHKRVTGSNYYFFFMDDEGNIFKKLEDYSFRSELHQKVKCEARNRTVKVRQYQDPNHPEIYIDPSRRQGGGFSVDERVKNAFAVPNIVEGKDIYFDITFPNGKEFKFGDVYMEDRRSSDFHMIDLIPLEARQAIPVLQN